MCFASATRFGLASTSLTDRPAGDAGNLALPRGRMMGGREEGTGMNALMRSLSCLGAHALVGILALTGPGVGTARADTVCSAWLMESTRFMHVPFGSFMPDRDYIPGSADPMHNIQTVDLPVNIGVIKCDKELILYDSGWKQQEYHKMTGTEHFTPLGDQLKRLGFSLGEVTKVVIGHGHWDHAGQLSDLPNAMLYVQREELKGIEWALNYPNPHIR